MDKCKLLILPFTLDKNLNNISYLCLLFCLNVESYRPSLSS